MAKGKKDNKPKDISPQGSSTYLGDQLTSQTVYNPQTGQMETHYYQDEATKQRQQQAQNQINNILPTLGQTAPEMSKQWDDIGKAFQDQQTDAFNRSYDPTLRNLREDVGSRFGTTQSSDYYDRLNDLEKNVRTPALLDISRTATQMKSNLYNQQESNKLQQLQSLGYILNGDQANFLNNVTNSQTSANQLNNFNLNNYAQQLNQYNNDLNRGSQNQNNVMNQFAGFIH